MQRSSRSSLAGTSATSAADFSTLSVNASQRHLSSSHGYDDDDDNDDFGLRTASRTSVVSFERDGQHTPTRLTEYAVVHQSRGGDRTDDGHHLRPRFSTPAPKSSPVSPQTPTFPAPPLNVSPEKTPTASLETPTYPEPPDLFGNSFQSGRQEKADKVRARIIFAAAFPSQRIYCYACWFFPFSSFFLSFLLQRVSADSVDAKQQQEVRNAKSLSPKRRSGEPSPNHTMSPDRVRIYVPYSDDSLTPTAVAAAQMNGSISTANTNGFGSSATTIEHKSPPLSDSNRLGISIGDQADGIAVSPSAAGNPVTPSGKKSKSPAKKGTKSGSRTTSSRL